jgi:hypothetical protein
MRGRYLVTFANDKSYFLSRVKPPHEQMRSYELLLHPIVRAILKECSMKFNLRPKVPQELIPTALFQP